MKPSIRAAELSDTAILSCIGADTFALACPPSTPPADLESYIETELTPKRFAEHLATDSTSLFAADVQRTVVGYLMLCREEAPPEVRLPKALELRRIYVRPQYHGQGVAAALMETAFETALAESYTNIWLGVSKQNVRGVRFYHKHGFYVAGEQRFPVGTEIHEDYIMVCDVAAAKVGRS